MSRFHFRAVASGTLLTLLTLLTAPTSVANAQRASGTIAARIETTAGTITVELDSAHAPISVSNFLRYVDAQAYDGGVFHRTVRADNQPRDSVKIGVIQGGANPARTGARFAPISLERTDITGLRHLDGTLSMARAGPNTATSDFFICVDDQPALDFGGHRNLDGQGFAAFGRVTNGMDVVRAIQQRSANGQTLAPPVSITRVTREK